MDISYSRFKWTSEHKYNMARTMWRRPLSIGLQLIKRWIALVINRINLYPVDHSAIGSPNTYPLDEIYPLCVSVRTLKPNLNMQSDSIRAKVFW